LSTNFSPGFRDSLSGMRGVLAYSSHHRPVKLIKA
jgi:hypothetical protein